MSALVISLFLSPYMIEPYLMMITTQQLQLLKEGNKKAFEALYRAYNARIYSFVLSMIGDAGVAKDITQDIFLQIWEKRLNIDLEGNLGGYLFKISQNMVYHYVRRELLLQNYVDKLSNESADESVEIDEEGDYLFLEEYILKLLEELPPARREVFMLYWKSGLNYREIAEQLDISEKTVATQVHRSLDFLRDKLGTIAFSVSLFLHHI